MQCNPSTVSNVCSRLDTCGLIYRHRCRRRFVVVVVVVVVACDGLPSSSVAVAEPATSNQCPALVSSNDATRFGNSVSQPAAILLPASWFCELVGRLSIEHGGQGDASVPEALRGVQS